MVKAKRIGNGIGQFILVSLPSSFTVVWTIDAALVPGADVFVLALVQAIFIGVFMAYRSRKRPR